MNTDSFSPVQQEVAQMSAVGLTDSEIASQLQLSPDQLAAVWRKLTHSLQNISRDAAVDVVMAQLVLEARAALMTKTDEMALIVRAADDKAVITLNSMGLITGVSREGERLLGDDVERLVGLPIDAILSSRAKGA